MQILTFRQLFRSTIQAAAFVAVVAVAYEAGAHDMGRRTASVVRSAVDQAKRADACTQTSVNTVSTSVRAPPGMAPESMTLWEAQSDLFFARAAQFVHAYGATAEHLRSAADALRSKADEPREQAAARQRAADALDRVADEIDRNIVEEDHIHRAVQAAFDSMQDPTDDRDRAN